LGNLVIGESIEIACPSTNQFPITQSPDYPIHDIDRHSLQRAALKGKNRPWFIQLLVRALKTALAGSM
jgi:hypothetical protein